MHRNPAIVHGIGVVTIVVFGMCGLFGFKKLFDKRPGLILNSAGIVDNASAISAGLIPWSEVLSTEIFTIRRQRLLIIQIRGPEQYIESAGPLKRVLYNANRKMYGSPIVISSNTLQIDFAELLRLVNQYLQKYGNSDRSSFLPPDREPGVH